MNNFDKNICLKWWKRMYPTTFSLAIVIVSYLLIQTLILYSNNSNPRPIGIDIEEKSISEINPFDSIVLDANSAYVFDIATGKVLFEKNSEQQWPLASLTKLVTAIVAEESVPDYTIIKITKEDLSQEGDSGLRVGERWKLKDLLSFTLVSSSNDGAHAVASAINAILPSSLKQEAIDKSANQSERNDFVFKMDNLAKSLGLAQTFFLNETGLDVSTSTSGAYGSARDVSRLLEYALFNHKDILDNTAYGSLEISSLDNRHKILNTNKVINNLPGLISSKTGFTDLSGGNLAVIFEVAPAHPIIVSVLGSTPDGRFTDISNLVQATIESVAKIQ